MPADPTLQLLHALRQKQGALSDRAFARLLRISHTTYASLLAGNRPIGLSLLTRVAVVYPDLDHLVMAYLRYRAAA